MELEAYVPQQHEMKPEVSTASVGWHLEHSILVINGVLSSLIKSKPEEYRWKWKLACAVIFTKGKIPRGRGRAPERVIPKTDFDPENVASLIANIRSYYPTLKELSAKHFFPHHIFGHLHKQKTFRFIEIHTRHHLNIIQDIVGKG